MRYASRESWWRGWAVALVAGAAALGAACSSDACDEGPFGGATCTYGADVTTGDTLIFRGETVTYQAVAIYGVGPGVAQSIRWGASDSTVLKIDVLTDGTAEVEGLEEGTSWIVAFVNEAFRDSAMVTVVVRAGDRWVNTYAGTPAGSYPALGTDSLVRVVTGGATPLLRILAPESGIGSSTATCFSAFGPSLGAFDAAYTTGNQCTRRHTQVGDSAWTAPAGGAGFGVAVAVDGGAITVSTDSVFRVDASGAVLWGLAVGDSMRTAPVIGPGGDVYVGFSTGGADSVARIALDGTTVAWRAAVPGLSPGTPAVTATRLFFGRPGGLFALDPAGVVTWDRSFSADNPLATATSATSSPVHDNVVLFVQNEEALYSYGIGGSFVWAADSLSYGPAGGPVGAPALLTDGTLVVPCVSGPGTRGVCSVRQINGRIAWRSPVVPGTVEGLAVGADGMIFVTRAVSGGGSQVAALWARVPPSTTGWPAEGGSQRHTRR